MIQQSLKRALWAKKRALLDFNALAKFSPDFARIYQKIEIDDKSALLSILDIFNLYSAMQATRKIPGDIAELGVYKGGSALLLCETKNEDKTLHLFDTFEGLPKEQSIDVKFNRGKQTDTFKEGEYAASLESVKHYLKNYKNVTFHKGFFPQSATGLEEKKFSFVHLDADLYQSTKDGLAFFYPRMSKGGIIISHDYPYAEGVRRAFTEFFSDKPEIVLGLLTKQALVVKL